MNTRLFFIVVTTMKHFKFTSVILLEWLIVCGFDSHPINTIESRSITMLPEGQTTALINHKDEVFSIS